MPCWPDIWHHFKRLLPMLVVLVAVFGYASLVALLLWAPKLRQRWLRITSRILGFAGVVLLLIILFPMLLGFMFAMGNPPTQSRTVQSRGGQQATLKYDGGFLGRDYTEVTLKKEGCCQHVPIFWHSGPSWFDDVKIEWLDETHLRLTYHVREGDPQHCEQRVRDTMVLCTSLPWPK